MGIISKVSSTDNVSIITFENAPAGIKFLSSVFDTAANEGINVDMISQNIHGRDKSTVSFTVIDNRVADILKVVKQLEKSYAIPKPLVSIGNIKINLFSEDMPNSIGVAADVFNKLEQANIDVMLVTTSDVDISFVVQWTDGDKAVELLQNAYS